MLQFRNPLLRPLVAAGHNADFVLSLPTPRCKAFFRRNVLWRTLLMNHLQKSGNYFSVLDGIRGIAAILVLVRHTPVFFGVEYPESFLAVDLFFVLSGIVITSSYEQRLLEGLTKRHFVWLRIVRILPLYILGTLLGIAGVFAGRPFEGHMPSAVALSLLLLPYLGSAVPFPFNNVAWSLFFELVANFVYAFFVRLLTNRVLLTIISASAIGMIIVSFQFGSLDLGWNQSTFYGGFLRVGYSFFAGILLYRQFIKGGSMVKGGRYNTVISLSVIAILAIVMMAKPSQALQPFYELIAVLFVFPSVAYLAMSLAPSKRCSSSFKFLGLVSYGIYTLHLPIGALVRGVLLKYAGISNAVTYSSAPWFGIGFVAVLALFSWLVDKIYDTPIRRLMLNLYPQPIPKKMPTHPHTPAMCDEDENTVNLAS